MVDVCGVLARAMLDFLECLVRLGDGRPEVVIGLLRAVKKCDLRGSVNRQRKTVLPPLSLVISHGRLSCAYLRPISRKMLPCCSLSS
jgi:hypothetical protein